jgi:hypothetical protein
MPKPLAGSVRLIVIWKIAIRPNGMALKGMPGQSAKCQQAKCQQAKCQQAKCQQAKCQQAKCQPAKCQSKSQGLPNVFMVFKVYVDHRDCCIDIDRELNMHCRGIEYSRSEVHGFNACRRREARVFYMNRK